MAEVRRLQTLTRDESLRLLRSVSWGRVVFTHLALPAIRPANHLVEGDQIVIRASYGAAFDSIVGVAGGTVVAYEADLIDDVDRLGWSVIVIGRAARLPEGNQATRYRQLLQPWVTADQDEIITIQAEMVDGYQLTHGPAEPFSR